MKQPITLLLSAMTAIHPKPNVDFHWNGYGKELADGEFHRFGMHWDGEICIAFFDGRGIGRADLIGLGSKDNGKTPSRGPCQKPGYMKLSCEAAVWAGAANQWEIDPTKEDEFVIDYVRVYEGTLPVSGNTP